ncbi:SIMPL domain-containing protein [Brevundimonas sp. UBA7664]|uniref:SIMPL domain-containing protein n=1 Tax=Brevundimonas sp. UBA7664 TaxID=1946141 RepID=UPI0025C16468|nr:SIMPL domain-containing protein [Brevundimonas sp. UBA7664]
MKSLTLVAGWACLLFAPAVSAQEVSPERASIVVTGTGRAEAPPDLFTVTAGIEGRGVDQVAALQALASRQRVVMEGLGRLEGLTSTEVTTDGAGIESISDPECGNSDYSPETCPIVGYSASMTVRLVGSPVQRAGDALSLAGELGARDARVVRIHLSDNSDLREAANRAAFADARRQADLLASAAGQRVVRTVRIATPDARSMASSSDALADIVDFEPRVRPVAPLVFAPPPTEFVTHLTVTFEIE